mgnify:CR=1 FL=1
MGRELGDLPRVENSRSQDAFNLISINTDIRKIKILRIGSYVAKNSLNERQKIELNY